MPRDYRSAILASDPRLRVVEYDTLPPESAVLAATFGDTLPGFTEQGAWIEDALFLAWRCDLGATEDTAVSSAAWSDAVSLIAATGSEIGPFRVAVTASALGQILRAADTTPLRALESATILLVDDDPVRALVEERAQAAVLSTPESARFRSSTYSLLDRVNFTPWPGSRRVLRLHYRRDDPSAVAAAAAIHAGRRRLAPMGYEPVL